MGDYIIEIQPEAQSSHNCNGFVVLITRAGRGDANCGVETSAPVEDGFGEIGVYVGSFWATYLARYSQPHECVAVERGLQDSGLEFEGLSRRVWNDMSD